MIKHLLLLTGAALVLASCNSDSGKDLEQKAQIDSAVNANATRHDAENAMRNDSTLRAVEKAKADSIVSANEKEADKHPAATHTPDSASRAKH